MDSFVPTCSATATEDFTPAYLEWFPYDLPEDVWADLNKRRHELCRHAPVLDVEQNRASASLLDHAIVPHLDSIVYGDNLPRLCHLINGWGDLCLPAGRVLDKYADFFSVNQRGRLAIKQCDPEGDFHAGQSLAYALMAGISPTDQIAETGISLADLLHEVQELPTNDATELGHLLFAIGWAQQPFGDDIFTLGHEALSIPQLLDRAVEAHLYGHFDVCRKFHLTEGLCAVAARTAYTSPYLLKRAQAFLNGQLETLLLLCEIRQEVIYLRAGGGSRERLEHLRSLMSIGSFLENEFYYVGHAAELLAFAKLMNYPIADEYIAAAVQLANLLNHDLASALPHIDLEASFLHLGHYRRGITLLEAVLEDGSTPELASYTGTGSLNSSSDIPPSASDFPFYRFAAPTKTRIPIIDRLGKEWVSRSSISTLQVRGSQVHFRRAGPAAWPREVHYEFLAYADALGIELHVELPQTHPAWEHLARLFDKFSQNRTLPMRYRANWEGEGFRLVILAKLSDDKEILFRIMHTLTNLTFLEIDQLLEVGGWTRRSESPGCRVS